MIFAIVPAGGQSKRMGQPKLALRLGDRTILEHVVVGLKNGGVNQVLVVLGPHGAEFAALVKQAGAEALVMPKPTPHMRNTVEAGLTRMRQVYEPVNEDVWLLAPVDHPLLSSAVTAALIAASQRDPNHSIFIPTYCEYRGHPVLFRWQHAERIGAFAPDSGLNLYVRSQASETAEIPVDDPDILVDIDTAEDYRGISQRHVE